MSETELLAERFERNREHLRAVAYRILGSRAEADDAVQEAWLRLQRSDASAVENLRAWLTSVVSRVCLDVLRSRKIRREEPIGPAAEAVATNEESDRETLLAESIGVAMLVVLERLKPAERVAFVLHDMFSLSFDEIAPIVGRAPAAARQMASRARRRVQGAPADVEADRTRQRQVVNAFLAASRGGDFAALLAVLDPDVVLRADAAAVEFTRTRANADIPRLAPETRGHENVAAIFKGRAKAAQLALIDGSIGLVIAPTGTPVTLFDVIVDDERIVEINIIADPKSIAALDVET